MLIGLILIVIAVFIILGIKSTFAQQITELQKENAQNRKRLEALEQQINQTATQVDQTEQESETSSDELVNVQKIQHKTGASINNQLNADSYQPVAQSDIKPSDIQKLPTLIPPAANRKTTTPSKQGKRKPSLEERLGGHLFLWIGGIALVLAGAFLVKYSFDSGLLSPLVRVILGAIFGVAVVGCGICIKQKTPKVSAALVGAGIGVLYAVILAASSLYGFIGPTAGFILMAILTAIAVALSLRHGPMVALLGLLGGYLTPALIGGQSNSMSALMGYLLLLELGLVATTTRRGWTGLTALTLVGTIIWAILATFQASGHILVSLWVGIFLLATAAIYAIWAIKRSTSDKAAPAILSIMASVCGLALLGTQAAVGTGGWIQWVLLGLLAAGALTVARFDPKQIALPWLSNGACVLTVVAARLSFAGGPHIHAHTAAWLLVGYGSLNMFGSYIAQWRSGREKMWSILTALTAAVYMLAYIAVANGALPTPLHTWMAAIALAVLLCAGAYPRYIIRTKYNGSSNERAMYALVLGAAALLTLGLAFALNQPWAALAWCVQAAGMAWIVRRFRIHILRWAIGWSAVLAAIALCVPGFFIIDSHFSINLLIFNQLLPAYGVPTVMLAIGAWHLRRAKMIKKERKQNLAGMLEGLAIAAGIATIALQVRHGFHRDELFQSGIGLYEWATYATVFLITSLLIVWSQWRFKILNKHQISLRQGGIVIAFFAVFSALIGTGLLANPLWTKAHVGAWPVVNGLLYIYGATALLAGALAGAIWSILHKKQNLKGAKTRAYITGTTALLLLFALVTFEVRQAFAGSILQLNIAPVTQAEWYTYSASWIVLGIVLAIVGVWRNYSTLRYGSLAIMLVAVIKVFALDTSHLADMYRVLSFLGLGISLIGLGYVYQRYVLLRAKQ